MGCAGVAGSVHDGAVCDVDIVQGRSVCLQLYITFGHGEAEARLVLPAFLRVHKSRADARLPLIKFAVVVVEAIHKLYSNADACRCLIDLLTVHKELGHSCGLIDQIRFSIFCAQAHVALRHFKGKGLTVLIVFRSPVAIRLCRQCRCAHAQHHAQRHKGREQPLGQGRLLHTEFLLFAYGGGVCVRLKNTIFHLLFQ